MDSSLEQEVLRNMQTPSDSSKLDQFQHELYTDQGSAAISYPVDIEEEPMEFADQDLITASRRIKEIKALGQHASDWVELPSTSNDILPVDEALEGFDEPPQRFDADKADKRYRTQIHTSEKIMTIQKDSTIVVVDDGSGLSSRRDIVNKSKWTDKEKDRRALVVHEDLRRHDNAFLHEPSGEIRYYGGRPVPLPPPPVSPQANRRSWHENHSAEWAEYYRIGQTTIRCKVSYLFS